MARLLVPWIAALLMTTCGGEPSVPAPPATELRFTAPRNGSGFPVELMFSSGPAWGYLDGDDLPDLFLPHHYGHRTDKLHDVLLVNNGDGSFSPSTLSIERRFGRNDLRDQHAAVWAALLSRDPTELDLYVSAGGARGDRAQRSRIRYQLLGNDSGALTNVAIDVGLQAALSAGPLHRGRITFPLDFDLDGSTDLLLAGEASPFRLLRTVGGQFEDVSVRTGVDEIRPRRQRGWKGIVVDLDGDGYEDLVIPMKQGLAVYRNNRGETFSPYPEFSIDIGATASIAVLEPDDDPFPDLVALPARPSAEKPIRILRNTDGSRFEVVPIEDAGLKNGGVQINPADLDNDGDPDLLVVTRHHLDLLENVGSGRFVKRSQESGIDALFNVDQPGKFGCVSLADYDLDGRLDIVAVRGHGGPKNRRFAPGPVLVARNDSRARRSVRLMLEGVESNPQALGARVALVDENGGHRYRRLSSGVAAGCQNDPALHFGVGSAEAVRIEIEWPSGRRSVHTELRSNELHRLREPGAAE